MNDTKITIERTSDYEVLSSFFCGVRELDQLIHKKENGLRSFIEDEDNHMYVVKKEEAPIALFVEHTALVETENFNTLAKEIDFISVRQDVILSRLKNGSIRDTTELFLIHPVTAS